MKKLYRFLGSLPMAVVLLVALAIALGVGTWCEARFGTPAAQHYVYHAGWFQTLLGFLAINLLGSALRRYPWKKHHIGFVMTHLGIITLLTGNLLGIWFGIEGNLIIPEGTSQNQLELSRDILWAQPDNPGTPITFPLDFNIKPWVHEVDRHLTMDLDGISLDITIDEYLPNTFVTEEVVSGEEIFPAIQLELKAPGQVPQKTWFFSRDSERFGAQWGPAHVLFFEVEDDAALALLENPTTLPEKEGKGTLRLYFTELGETHEIPVDSFLGKTLPIEGTPYTLSFRDYFPDFIITEEGPATRSEDPNNPALAFTLKGPEGEDPFLVFTHHPEFVERHGLAHVIPVKATLEMDAALPPLPPGLIGIVRSPTSWRVITTSLEGEKRKSFSFSLNKTYQHPWLDMTFRILEEIPAARVARTFQLKNNTVERQAIHVIVGKGEAKESLWLARGGVSHLALGEKILVLSYQSAKKELPFSVKLHDFRKIEYPGTTMASGFESDIEIEDLERGVRFSRMISMNNPLTYRGYTMFQASFIEEPIETTVLAVRKDSGTPVVYAGFLIIVAGILVMFYVRPGGQKRPRKQ